LTNNWTEKYGNISVGQPEECGHKRNSSYTGARAVTKGEVIDHCCHEFALDSLIPRTVQWFGPYTHSMKLDN
jgi:hypothetical protein